MTDEKNTISEAKNTISEAKTTITDADAKRKRRQQAYARRIEKKRRAAAMYAYTLEEAQDMAYEDSERHAKKKQQAEKKKRQHHLTMEISQFSDNLKQPADNNASLVNNDSPGNEEGSGYGVDLSDIYDISPVDKHGCSDFFLKQPPTKKVKESRRK